MEQYIDKASVVAEIEREKAYAQTLGDNAINSSMRQFYDGMKEGCNSLLNSINALEVKDVDLEKEIQDYIYKLPHSKTHFYDGLVRSWREQNVIETAKHFFELGLKVQKGG